MKVNKIKKTIALILIVAIVLLLPISAFAEEAPSPKEEVIYAVADPGGKVNNIDIVNIFGKGNIIDYGKYSEIKMMTTNEKLKHEDDKITFSSDADRVYYQGTSSSKELPWIISLVYCLDGKRITPADLAGQSGDLEIKFSVTKNDKIKGNFFDTYALQTTFKLDTEKCKDITADGANIANAGSYKMITYTILPGKGISSSIKAKVFEFELEETMINGVRLGLDIDINDDQISDKVSQLISAGNALNSGAQAISSGLSAAAGGSGKIASNSGQLTEGISSLNSGIEDLRAGSAKIRNGLGELASKSDQLVAGSAEVLAALDAIDNGLNSMSAETDGLSKLVEASSRIRNGISQMNDGAKQFADTVGYDQYKAALAANGLDIDQLVDGNNQAAVGIQEQIQKLESQLAWIEPLPLLDKIKETLRTQIEQLRTLITLLNANNAAITAPNQYLTPVSEKLGEFSGYVNELNSNYASFDNGIQTFAGSLTTIMADFSKLKAGIDKLTKEYAGLNSGISAYAAGVKSISAGYDELDKGIVSVSEGGKALLNGSGQLTEAEQKLYEALQQLSSGSGKLADGTSEFASKTSNAEGQIKDTVDEMVSSISGGDQKVESFASAKNTNVKSVQFVIKTTKIEQSDHKANAEPPVKELSLLQKLLKLFGIEWN